MTKSKIIFAIIIALCNLLIAKGDSCIQMPKLGFGLTIGAAKSFFPARLSYNQIFTYKRITYSAPEYHLNADLKFRRFDFYLAGIVSNVKMKEVTVTDDKALKDYEKNDYHIRLLAGVLGCSIRPFSDKSLLKPAVSLGLGVGRMRTLRYKHYEYMQFINSEVYRNGNYGNWLFLQNSMNIEYESSKAPFSAKLGIHSRLGILPFKEKSASVPLEMPLQAQIGLCVSVFYLFK